MNRLEQATRLYKALFGIVETFAVCDGELPGAPQASILISFDDLKVKGNSSSVEGGGTRSLSISLGSDGRMTGAEASFLHLSVSLSLISRRTRIFLAAILDASFCSLPHGREFDHPCFCVPFFPARRPPPHSGKQLVDSSQSVQDLVALYLPSQDVAGLVQDVRNRILAN